MVFEVGRSAIVIIQIVSVIVICLFGGCAYIFGNSSKLKAIALVLSMIVGVNAGSTLIQYAGGDKLVDGQKFYLCLQVKENGDITYINSKYEESSGHTSLDNAVAAGGDLNTYGKDIEFLNQVKLFGFITINIRTNRDVLYLNDATATSLGIITQEEFDRRVDEWNSTLPASSSDAS